jgi:hypothetical protein
MPKTLETIRDFIVERQEDLAREIVEHHWKRRPALEQRYGKKGMARCLEDARYHLQYLSEAVGAGEPALFVHYATWAKTMLIARNIPVEDLVERTSSIDANTRGGLPEVGHWESDTRKR